MHVQPSIEVYRKRSGPELRGVVEHKTITGWLVYGYMADDEIPEEAEVHRGTQEHLIESLETSGRRFEKSRLSSVA